MTQSDDPHDLKARARRAFERSTAEKPEKPEEPEEPEVHKPADPAMITKMERAMRSLRRLDREIFLAARLDAMSYADIAARTGLSVTQLEHRMTRALRQIVRSQRGERVRRRWWWPF